MHVEGAKFSVGDLHFSQGDGEISFCGAIEMAGVITLKINVMKGGVADLGMKSPIFIPGPVEPQFSPGRMLTFEGFSVDENGKQHYMDVTVAYRQACLRVIEYLKRFGYSGEQIYLLLSCAPIQGHVAGIVDIPNACTTIGLPMDIFDFDITPGNTSKVKKLDMGSCAYTSHRKWLEFVFVFTATREWFFISGYSLKIKLVKARKQAVPKSIFRASKTVERTRTSYRIQ